MKSIVSSTLTKRELDGFFATGGLRSLLSSRILGSLLDRNYLRSAMQAPSFSSMVLPGYGLQRASKVPIIARRTTGRCQVSARFDVGFSAKHLFFGIFPQNMGSMISGDQQSLFSEGGFL
jgi:hypothetical protein